MNYEVKIKLNKSPNFHDLLDQITFFLATLEACQDKICLGSDFSSKTSPLSIRIHVENVALSYNIPMFDMPIGTGSGWCVAGEVQTQHNLLSCGASKTSE